MAQGILLHRRKAITGEPFITTWNMTAGEFTLPTQNYNYDCAIDWGDGTSSSHTSGNPIHTYASDGEYQIKISGSYAGFYFWAGGSAVQKIIEVNQWGSVNLQGFYGAFANALNLITIPNKLPKMNILNLASAFSGCISLMINPEHLFDDITNVGILGGFLFNCISLTGNAPKLWEMFPSVEGLNCFYNCTNLSNYDEIPDYWK